MPAPSAQEQQRLQQQRQLRIQQEKARQEQQRLQLEAARQQQLKQQQEKIRREQLRLKQQQEQQKKAQEQLRLKQQQEQEKRAMELKRIQQQEAKKKALEQQRLQQQKEDARREEQRREQLKKQQDKAQQQSPGPRPTKKVHASQQMINERRNIEKNYENRRAALVEQYNQAKKAGDWSRMRMLGDIQHKEYGAYKNAMKSHENRYRFYYDNMGSPQLQPPSLLVKPSGESSKGISKPLGQSAYPAPKSVTVSEVTRLGKEKEKTTQSFREQWSRLTNEKIQAEIAGDTSKAKALSEQRKLMEKKWGQESKAYQKQIDAAKAKQPTSAVAFQPGKVTGGGVASPAFDRRGAAGGTIDAYGTAKTKVQKTEAEIKKLEADQKRLDEQLRDKQKVLDDMQGVKGGSVQSTQAADEFQKEAKKDIQKIMQEKKDLDKQKENLLQQKAEQEKQVKAAIPPPPWENRKSPDPKDFATQKQNVYQDYLWKQTFGATKEERENARQNYKKVMAEIEKKEGEAKAAAITLGKTPPPPKVIATKTGPGQTPPPAATTPSPAGSGQATNPVAATAAKSSFAPGQESQAEIWEVGPNAPQSLFLTEAQVTEKKQWFKDNPYGFHEIKTKDGKVIDVIANKNPDVSESDKFEDPKIPPPTGYITMGKGKDAKTTLYQYGHGTTTVDGKPIYGVGDKVVSKTTYLSKREQEQIEAIRKKQREVLQRDTTKLLKKYWSSGAIGSSNDPKELTRRLMVTKEGKELDQHYMDFEHQIKAINPDYEPRSYTPQIPGLN